MDTIELEKVAEIIGNLGNNATTAFSWYLGAGLAQSFLGYVVGTVAIYATYKTFMKLIQAINTKNTAVRDMCHFRDKLGIGHRGYLTDGERDAVIDAVSRLIENSKK